ncbi:MAG: FRG domain-containing protein [Bacteroidaceae bacterium]|nr:FRG domain-containing protein [Bacteroidaceae bacterium]
MGMEKFANPKKNTSSEIVLVNSLSAFVAEIEKLTKQFEGQKFVYRGHASTSYELKPSIGRNNYNERVEQSMLNEFKRRYYPYTSERVNKKLDVLFLAQHYRLPTRLLDWSFNPLIAMYFACQSKLEYDESIQSDKEMDGIVYVRSIFGPSECLLCEEKDVDPFKDFEKNKFLLPDNFDVRFRNQQGLFEIFANPTQCNDAVKLKIKVLAANKKEILLSLSNVGITEDFVYPDLEHLAKSIKKQYGR